MTPPLLRLAIAEQYAAFSSPQPRQVSGCDCCTTPAALCALTAQPRELLDPAIIDFYARKAVTTIGTVNDLRYFWPRLAELAVTDQLITDVETVLGKPLYAEHHRWPRIERDALITLAQALGERLAVERLEEGATDKWVCAIGLLTHGLTSPEPILRPLLATTDAAWYNLQDFIRRNEPTILRKGRLASGFWDNAPEAAARVFAWATTEPMTQEARHALAAEPARLYGTIPPAF